MTHAAARTHRSRHVFGARTAGWLSVSLVFALAACGGPSPTSPPVNPTASPIATTAAVTPTEAASQAPPATQAATAEVCAPAPDCFVPAGTYHAASFDGGMTFRIHGDVWNSVAYVPEMLSLNIDDTWVVFMSGEVNVRTKDGAKITTDPAVARRALEKLAGIDVTAVEEPVTIDGAEAAVFEVANTGSAPATLWSMGQTSAIYGLDPGRSIRVYWVDRDGTPFLLALEETTARLPLLVEDAQGLIASIAFD
jgi:hypothetical protein